MSGKSSSTFIKRHGIYYTNKNLANKMIDALDIDYSKEFSIAEIAVGEGHILKYIVLRYLRSNKSRSLSDKICFLENKIFAFDNREEAIVSCKDTLNKVVEKEIGRRIQINWNIKVIDAIDKDQLSKYSSKFDYIISNPPFVAKKNLSLKQRNFLDKESKFCQKFNYNFYYYFFEVGFDLWNKLGKMVYITPNNYLKAKSAERMNNFFFREKYVEKIIDFRNKLMFEDASVYTAITVFSNNNATRIIEDETGNIISKINYKNGENITLLKNASISKLGNYAKIRTGIATLQDKVFVIKSTEIVKIGKNFIFFRKNNKEFKIEKKIVREAYRASNSKNKNFVIFPYTFSNNRFSKLGNMGKKYPLAYEYLINNLSVKYRQKYGIYWGRTQGLYDYELPKVVCPRVMKPYTDSFGEIIKGLVISGVYIVIENKLSAKELVKFLNSKTIQKLIVKYSPVYVKDYVSISSNLLKNIPLTSFNIKK